MTRKISSFKSLNGCQEWSHGNFFFFLASQPKQRAVVLICFPERLLGDLSFHVVSPLAFTCASRKKETGAGREGWR